jgi:hypothetical protein
VVPRSAIDGLRFRSLGAKLLPLLFYGPLAQSAAAPTDRLPRDCGALAAGSWGPRCKVSLTFAIRVLAA